MHDLKLVDYWMPIGKCTVGQGEAYLSEVIRAEESKSQEENYLKPVTRGELGIFDPAILIN